MEIAIPIVALVVGSLVTLVIAHFYYKRSTKDFKDLVGKLDKIAQSDKAGVLFSKIAATGNGQQAEVSTSNIVHTLSSPDLYPRVQYLMKDVENVLSKHEFKRSPDTGSLNIAELSELADRMNGITQLIKSYRDWRVHVGD
jgi:hypothetical protein